MMSFRIFRYWLARSACIAPELLNCFLKQIFVRWNDPKIVLGVTICDLGLTPKKLNDFTQVTAEALALVDTLGQQHKCVRAKEISAIYNTPLAKKSAYVRSGKILLLDCRRINIIPRSRWVREVAKEIVAANAIGMLHTKHVIVGCVNSTRLKVYCRRHVFRFVRTFRRKRGLLQNSALGN